MPNVIFGDRIYREGSWLELNEVVKGGNKSSRTDVIKEETQRTLCTQGKSRESMGRGGHLQARKRGLTQKPAPAAAPWSWTSSPQNCEVLNFCCLNPQDMIFDSLRRLTWLLNEPHHYYWLQSLLMLFIQFEVRNVCPVWQEQPSSLPLVGWMAQTSWTWRLAGDPMHTLGLRFWLLVEDHNFSPHGFPSHMFLILWVAGATWKAPLFLTKTKFYLFNVV